MPTRRAVIDIGTNSVKLLVGDVTGQQVQPVLEESEQTRLGQGFYPHHRLQTNAMVHTARAVAAYTTRAKSQGAETVRVIGTSAVRDAFNAEDLIGAVREASGLGIEVISGDQEAEWAFRGVSSDPAYATHPLLLLDVGGGSTEFIVGAAGRIHYRNSFKLGTVRLLEMSHLADPPTAEQRQRCLKGLRDFFTQVIQPEVNPALEPFRAESLHLVGTGGTTTILARMQLATAEYDRAQIESVALTQQRMGELNDRLWSVPLATRKQIVGVPPNRADVILMGAAIYDTVMGVFGFPELRITTRGLRFAALMDP